MADTLSTGGLAAMGEDDDIKRLYEGQKDLRHDLTELASVVSKQVTIAEFRRPLHDTQIAELKALAQQNTRDISEIKGHIRDLTTIVRVVRWGGAAAVATGGAGLAILSGWWDEIRQAFR